MSRIFKCVLAGLAMFATLGAQSDAALVRVQIDPFGSTGFGTTAVFTSGGLTVNRTITAGGAGTVSISGGNLVIGNASNAAVTYSVTGGTFGDVFATDPGIDSVLGFDGFSFDAAGAAVTGGQGQVAISGTPGLGTTTIVSGDNLFRSIALATATSATITFSNIRNVNASAHTVLVGNVSAVPEPSALLLVGSILGVGLARRRRS
jgi:hypothetical protein